MKELPYVFLFGSFFTAAYFHRGGHRHFSFSHCRYKNVHIFVAMKFVSFVFYLSLLSMLVQTLKLSHKKNTWLQQLSIIDLHKYRWAPALPYYSAGSKCKIRHWLNMYWVNGHRDGHRLPKFFTSIAYHFFLPMVLCCAHFMRARAPL